MDSADTPATDSAPRAAGGEAGVEPVVDAAVDPDLELLRATADGDGDAFERLVERHQDRVLSLCRRFLHDREEARDAAQDVFLKLWRKAGSFRPRARVSTWIHRIAVNHCLNRLRRRKVVRFFSFEGIGSGDDADETGFDPPAPDAGPDEVLAARRRWAATRRALARLPESQRVVVVLAKLEGLPRKEIAAILGLSVTAVESRLHRALRRLETLLEEERGADGPGDAP